MPERPWYVVDASVAIKWYLKDEEYTAQATQVLADYQDGAVSLTAPDHLLYEVPHGLLRAVQRLRIQPSQAERQLQHFLLLRLPTQRGDRLMVEAYRYALQFGCSLYDAVYLALAEATSSRYIHADHRLKRALGGRFPLELWIEDYSAG